MSTFNIGSQHAGVVQNVAGDLTIAGGVHGAIAPEALALRGAVARIRETTAALDVLPVHRARVEQPLVAAATEAARDEPDRARIGRMLGDATAALAEAGALGGTVVTALRTAAGILGPAGHAVLALL